MPTKSSAKSAAAAPQRNVALAQALAVRGDPMYKIAAECGLHPRRLSELVKGKLTVSPPVQARIAKTLGVSQAELFGSNGDG